MKPRKALKRLKKVESLLANVIEGLKDNLNGVGDLLATAKESVQRAKGEVDLQLAAAASRKPPAKATAASARRLSPEGRKKISLAAKKRWASAKRKGLNAVTGQRLKKSA